MQQTVHLSPQRPFHHIPKNTLSRRTSSRVIQAQQNPPTDRLADPIHVILKVTKDRRKRRIWDNMGGFGRQWD